eukprot:scaffold77685_cov15-Tisochrysis_lutea.AAC.1
MQAGERELNIWAQERQGLWYGGKSPPLAQHRSAALHVCNATHALLQGSVHWSSNKTGGSKHQGGGSCTSVHRLRLLPTCANAEGHRHCSHTVGQARKRLWLATVLACERNKHIHTYTHILAATSKGPTCPAAQSSAPRAELSQLAATLPATPGSMHASTPAQPRSAWHP